MNEDTSRVKAALGSWAQAVIDAAAPDLAERVRPAAPVGHPDPDGGGRPGGELRDSIRADPASVSAGPRYTSRVVAPVPQAVYTDRGTPAHTIPPRPGGRLAFYSTWYGARIRLGVDRSVNHPGNAAMNWWEPALRAGFGDALAASAAGRMLGGG